MGKYTWIDFPYARAVHAKETPLDNQQLSAFVCLYYVIIIHLYGLSSW